MKKQNVISTPKARLRPSPYAFTRVTTAPVRECFELTCRHTHSALLPEPQLNIQGMLGLRCRPARIKVSINPKP